MTSHKYTILATSKLINKEAFPLSGKLLLLNEIATYHVTVDISLVECIQHY